MKEKMKQGMRKMSLKCEEMSLMNAKHVLKMQKMSHRYGQNDRAKNVFNKCEKCP